MTGADGGGGGLASGSGGSGGDGATTSGSGGASASGAASAGKPGSGGSSGATTGGAAGGNSGGRAGAAGTGSGAKAGGGSSGGGAIGSGGLGMGGSIPGEGGEGGGEPCPGGDCCPDDDDKTDPGVCGCGVADTDSDMDTIADCIDGCPLDADRTDSGGCGCGVTGVDADCLALSSALVHRYSFSDTDTTVTDSVGTLDGTLRGTGTAQSDGVLSLTGGVAPADDANQQYAELPSGCLDGLVDATLEAWVTWSTSCTPAPCTDVTSWQRVLDFGEASTTSAGANLFLTTSAGSTGPVRSAATTTGANNEVATGFRLDGMPIQAGSFHFAIVIDDTGDEARLYVNGEELGSVAYTATLASIVTTNCWLGRSNYATDAYFNGTFDEFRIYDAALSASAILQSYTSGPNAPYL